MAGSLPGISIANVDMRNDERGILLTPTMATRRIESSEAIESALVLMCQSCICGVETLRRRGLNSELDRQESRYRQHEVCGARGP